MISLKNRTLYFGLGKNYGFELSMFHKVNLFSNSINFIHIDAELLYDNRRDHNPQLCIGLIILNFSIIDFMVYNVNDHDAY